MEKTTDKTKTLRLVLSGVFAALLAVFSQISIPTPVGIPVTLQTFAVALCGYVLGPALGTISVAVYLALGAVGVPVFAGFSGGVGVFAGFTGGYMWGFLPMVLLCGVGRGRKNMPLSLLVGTGGLAACHALGTIQYAILSGSSPWECFLIASAPYLIKDIASVVLAKLAALAIDSALKKAGLGKVG